MSTGTRPEGAQGEASAAKWVQQAFSDIAPRYDLLNHLLSFNIDKRWRERLLRTMKPVLAKPEAVVLDLCCGTGDVLVQLQSAASTAVIGADFCHPMLVSAKKKIQRAALPSLLFEGDALQLPLADSSLDGIAIAFGFRNLVNYGAGLNELHRVLRRGALLTVLEFSHPRGFAIRAGYSFYSRAILPRVGRLVSGSASAYSYLPASIRQFPRAEELLRMMLATGFRKAEFQLLTGGVAAIHTATK